MEFVYHVYTISSEQGKKKTVLYTDNLELAKELCENHILYGYEVIELNNDMVLNEEIVCVN